MSIEPVDTVSFGKVFRIKPKGSLTIDDSQADQIAQELLYRFGFLKDVTRKPSVLVEEVSVIEKNKKGKNVTKKKKVVRIARGIAL